MVDEKRINKFKQKFIDKYGLDKWGELQFPMHLEFNSLDHRIGEIGHERIVYRLLEMFDFQCFKYGDNQGIDEEWAKDFLIEFKDVVGDCNIDPPSFIGLMAGAYSFLYEDDENVG